MGRLNKVAYDIFVIWRQLMKWCGGGGSRSWFSNEAMAIDSNAAGGFIDVPLGAGTNWGRYC